LFVPHSSVCAAFIRGFSPMSSELFPNPASLIQIEGAVWRLLQKAATERSGGWRLPVLATVSDGVVRQRTVVLRQVDVLLRQILVHTDIRSQKVAAIHQQPLVSWLFYDAELQVQLHLRGRAEVHTDDQTAQDLWDQEPESSLRAYLGPLRPGTACEGAEPNLPHEFLNELPTRQQLQAGRRNFAVISCLLQSAEWLQLGKHGHRRATFEYQDGRLVDSSWVAP
jgi:pyridoxamine 5'-phosphate oxidase